MCDQITENTIKDLQHLFTTNGGKKSVHFTIWDAKEKIELNTPSRNIKVTINNELIEALEKKQIDYKLN